MHAAAAHIIVAALALLAAIPGIDVQPRDVWIDIAGTMNVYYNMCYLNHGVECDKYRLIFRNVGLNKLYLVLSWSRGQN